MQICRAHRRNTSNAHALYIALVTLKTFSTSA